MRKNRLSGMLLVYAVLLLLCGLRVAGAGEEAASLSRTTGLPTDKPYRPVMVVVSNAPNARKVINFVDVDVVYEAIIQGPGFTRYTAVYNDVHPEEVGSVRSARPYHAHMREEWDCPIVFGSSHGSDAYDIYDYFKDTRLPQGFLHDRMGSYPFSTLIRSKEIESPHNLFVRMQALVADYWPVDPEHPEKQYEPRPAGLLFSQTPTMGESPATRVDIVYDRLNYYASYCYDEESGLYSRSYAGYPMIDRRTRAPVMASNIIVQRAEHSYVENVASRPAINLIGSGPADVFIEGTHIRGYWRRNSAQEPTEYYCSEEEDAERILLKPGKTFIQLFPLTGEVYEGAEEPGHITYTLVKLNESI